jgi:hypothetical protein
LHSLKNLVSGWERLENLAQFQECRFTKSPVTKLNKGNLSFACLAHPNVLINEEYGNIPSALSIKPSASLISKGRGKTSWGDLVSNTRPSSVVITAKTSVS